MTPETPTAEVLERVGLSPERAAEAAALVEALEGAPDACWRRLQELVLSPEVPFAVHALLYAYLADCWDADRLGPLPAWSPDPDEAAETNVAGLARELGLEGYDALQRWSVEDRAGYWRLMIEKLGIRFRRPWAEDVLRLAPPDARGVQRPTWLAKAKLNVAESCFGAPADQAAILWRAGPDAEVERWTYGGLERLAGRVASALGERGFAPGDRVAIGMPMTPAAVAAYLGVVMAGCAAVSIADSFAAPEVATRLRLAGARAVLTQDVILRGGRELPLYARVVEAEAPLAVVLPGDGALRVELRPGDLVWDDFLSDHPSAAVARDPHDESNVLFSSGTAGDPKAIPWSHTTPIKAAADGYAHQDVRPGDVLCWPTSLGWMMGPWLVYAALVNRATIALYGGAPTGADFCRFVEDAGVTMLGVVPSLVAAWRGSDATAGRDWSAIRCFSSTGECSSPEDMLWLMSRVPGYRPVLEYCGGTEVGGGYVTGTLVQAAAPATFTTPALGLDLELRDADGAPARQGEVFLVPPSIGLSLELLNADHDAVYFEGAPTGPDGGRLRRHGDALEALPGGGYRAHGRVDDAMNLGGVKVSAAELEAVLNGLDGVQQTAAIAVPGEGGGPARLVVYAEPLPGSDPLDPAELRDAFQARIRRDLNPLFKVAEVVVVERLPRTASNKVMRRVLRREHPVG